MPNQTTLHTPPSGAAPGGFAIRSAGRSVKGGAREQNQDYICLLDFPADSPLRGAYAVADGSLSTRQGERASEVAVETLKSAFRELASGPPDTARFKENLFTTLLPEAGKALIQARNGIEPGEKFVSSLIGCYLYDQALYLALAGNGAAFHIKSGRIQRITPDNTGAAEHAKALLGLEEPAGKYALSQVDVHSGDHIILCSDGALERLDTVAMLETMLEATSPQEAVDMLLSKLETRGSSDDASIVVISVEKPGEEKTRFVQRIRYPLPVVLTKYAIAGAVLVLLALLLNNLNLLLEKETPAPQGVKRTLTAPKPEPGPLKKNKPRPPASAALPARASVKLLINTEPEGARVVVNDRQLPGQTPMTTTVPAGREAVISFSLKGFNSQRRSFQIPGDVEQLPINVEMIPEDTPQGVIEIVCRDACDGLTVDGRPSGDATYPAQQIKHSAAQGEHTLVATRRGVRKSQTVTVEGGGQLAVTFDFGPAPKDDEARTDKQQQPGNKTTSKQQPPQRKTDKPKSTIQVHSNRDDDSAPARSGNATTKSEVAYVTVATSTTQGASNGFRVKIQQGGRLVATGSSGSPIRLEPGSYIIEVSREGYHTQETQRYIGSGRQTVSLFMKEK